LQNIVDVINHQAMTATHPGDALHRLLHAYKRALREASRADGIDLPPSHIRAMKAICHLPDCTAHELAQHFRRDKAQITRVVHDLCDAGLIRQQADPTDRRRRLLVPTSAGKAMQTRIAAAERQAGMRMVRGLSAASVAEFVRLAQVMADNLDPPE
jgi:DNA-binding MarR family transcriptional regulator